MMSFSLFAAVVSAEYPEKAKDLCHHDWGASGEGLADV